MCTNLAEMAILYSKDLTTAKKVTSSGARPSARETLIDQFDKQIVIFQIVRDTTCIIGCGFAQCGNKKTYVCNYITGQLDPKIHLYLGNHVLHVLINALIIFAGKTV